MDEGTDDQAKGVVGVIARSALILRLLGDMPTGLSLGDISKRIGLARSTVQRLVNALEEEGLIMSGTTGGKIALGPVFLQLAKSARPIVLDRIHPIMETLSKEIGETVDFSVVQRKKIIFLDQVIGSHRLLAASHVGDAFPLYCSSVGKSYLALLEDKEVERLIGTTYQARTQNTLIDLSSLLTSLTDTRASGVGCDEEEYSEGISALGIAFEGIAGDWYGVSIPMPVHRYRQKKNDAIGLLKSYLPEMTGAAMMV